MSQSKDMDQNYCAKCLNLGFLTYCKFTIATPKKISIVKLIYLIGLAEPFTSLVKEAHGTSIPPSVLEQMQPRWFQTPRKGSLVVTETFAEVLKGKSC